MSNEESATVPPPSAVVPVPAQALGAAISEPIARAAFDRLMLLAYGLLAEPELVAIASALPRSAEAIRTAADALYRAGCAVAREHQDRRATEITRLIVEGRRTLALGREVYNRDRALAVTREDAGE